MPKYGKEEEKYLAKCDVCGQVLPCYYSVDGLYGEWSLCEECYHKYRLQINTMHDRVRERIIKEWILNKIQKQM